VIPDRYLISGTKSLNSTYAYLQCDAEGDIILVIRRQLDKVFGSQLLGPCRPRDLFNSMIWNMIRIWFMELRRSVSLGLPQTRHVSLTLSSSPSKSSYSLTSSSTKSSSPSSDRYSTLAFCFPFPRELVVDLAGVLALEDLLEVVALAVVAFLRGTDFGAGFSSSRSSESKEAVSAEEEQLCISIPLSVGFAR
jgi:hypothetical protein